LSSTYHHIKDKTLAARMLIMLKSEQVQSRIIRESWIA